MKDLLFRLEDAKTNTLVIDNIPANIFMLIQKELKNDGNKKVNVFGKLAKVIKLSSHNYVVYAFTYNQDYIKSNRLIKSEVEIMLAAAKNIADEIQRAKERAESQTKRLIHNLKNLAAKTSQEIYFVALQTKLMESPKNSLIYVEKQVTERPKEAAKALLTILKYSTAQTTEFAAFQKLNGDVGMLKKEPHKIHKIIMGVLYLYFQDFTDRHVHVEVERSDLQGNFDYDSIHVCVYHLIENAAKYVKNGGQFNIHISKSNSELNITFEMESLTIYDDEVEKIFREGFSGKLAMVEELQGDGIGLFLAKRMAIMNGGNLVAHNGKPQQTDPKYARNRFTLTLQA